MILALSIQNVALIDKAEIQFEEGLNVLTGETGAGKSIVIDSVMLLLGSRASKEIIRTGEEKAIVEGIFFVDSNKDKIVEILEEAGLSLEEDDTLIINREITTSGRNYCRINGRIVPLSFLAKIGSFLVDILGQHEHQYLLDNSKHLSLLDSFGDEEFINIKAKIKELLEQYREIQRELTKFFTDEKEKASAIELLKYQIDEIEKGNLSVEEEKKLLERRNLLINFEKLFNSLNSSYKILYESSGGFAVLDNLHVVLKNLETAASIDEKLKGLKEKIENITYELEDCALQVRDYLSELDFSQQSLDEVERRLDQINTLKRKYGPTIQHILEFKEGKIKELEDILNSEERQQKLKLQQQKLWDEMINLSGILHLKRRKIAEHIEKNINNILAELNMPNAFFKVEIQKSKEPTETGFDNVEFLISTNIGEPLKPLSKIASGGELSRIMLALKTILADADGIPTLIFDEVDTGISGKTAQLVAEKMAYLSKKHQIICVTHLPQIAAMADAHHKISKITHKNRTYIHIEKLDYQGKINELSRIMSGSNVTQTTIEHSNKACQY